MTSMPTIDASMHNLLSMARIVAAGASLSFNYNPTKRFATVVLFSNNSTIMEDSRVQFYATEHSAVIGGEELTKDHPGWYAYAFILEMYDHSRIKRVASWTRVKK